MTKMIVFLIAVLFSLAMLTYAAEAKETIDLQRYVSCSLTECQLSVDINELTLSSEGKTFLKNIKQGDLDAAVSGLPSSLSDFTVTVKDKEKLIVTAEIEPASQNYWYMEFSNFILDPWFNSSYPYRQNVTLKSPTGGDVGDVLVNLTFPTQALMTSGTILGCNYVIIWDNDNDIPLNYTMEGCGTNFTQYWTWVPLLKADNTTSLSFLYGNLTQDFDAGSDICGIGINNWYPANQTQIADIVSLTDICQEYNLGVNQGDPAIEASYILNGTDYDGDDCVKAATGLDNLATFSVETWIKMDADGALDTAIIKGDLGISAGDREWSILQSNSVDCNGKLAFGKMSDSCSEAGEIWACSDDIGTGSWNYFVGVRDTATIQAYTDGNAGSAADCTHNQYTGGSLVLGAMDCTGATQYELDGHLDNVRIWSRALTADEIDIMYNYFTNPAMTVWNDEEEFNGTVPAPPETPTFNYTYTVNIDLNNAPAICLADNVTRYRYTTINGANINETYVCPNGCDNVTMDCIPPVYQQNIYILFGFAAVMIIAVWLLRRK